MTERDATPRAFVKSSYSADSGCCVEVARQTDTVSVRDSTDREGPVLDFPVRDWRAFVTSLKFGSFDVN